MFDRRWRATVEPALRPVGAALRRAGLSADHLTAAGLLLSAASALAVASGRLVLGTVLLGASAVPDVLDGAVAKASGTASPRGAFFDSVADRVSDSLVLGGVAWYLASESAGHLPVLPLAVLAASFLVPYERARAESLGFSARGGLMERAERIFLLGLGLAFGVLLVPVLWVMLALTLVTAVHRFVMVWRQASAPRRPVEDRDLGRWRGWRPTVGFGPGSRGERTRWRRSRAPRSRPAGWRRTRPGR